MKQEDILTVREQKRKRRHKCYASKAWQDLRKEIIMESPLCVECLKENKITAVEELHHTNHPFREQDDAKMWEKFLDKSSILPLCKYHHIQKHNPDGGLTMKEKIQKYS